MATALLIKGFGERFMALLDNTRQYPAGAKARALAVGRTFHVSPQTARKWLKGMALPNPVILVAISAMFDVTIDWLLSGRSAGGVRQATTRTTPYYRLTDFVPSDGGHCFVQIGNLHVELSGESKDDCPGCAWLCNWIAMEDPPFQNSDSILLNLADLRLMEDGIYLVRSASVLSWRRISIPLTGDAVFSFISRSGRSEKIAVPPDDIEFNPSADINIPASGKKLMIVGRAVAIRRNIGFQTTPNC